jgi:hypothetical protein
LAALLSRKQPVMDAVTMPRIELHLTAENVRRVLNNLRTAGATTADEITFAADEGFDFDVAADMRLVPAYIEAATVLLEMLVAGLERGEACQDTQSSTSPS